MSLQVAVSIGFMRGLGERGELPTVGGPYRMADDLHVAGMWPDVQS